MLQYNAEVAWQGCKAAMTAASMHVSTAAAVLHLTLAAAHHHVLVH